MNNLFLLLFLVSFICLIIGLVKPTFFSSFIKGEITKKIGLIFGIATIVFFVLFGATTSLDKTKNEVTQNNSQKTIQPTTPTVTTKYIYDIPALIGKNIDEARQILGTTLDKDLTEPTDEQIKLGADEWNNLYKKDDQNLLVTFNPNTRKIIDFFLIGDNKSKLLEVGNLKENDQKYTIEQVKQLINPSAITGIKIIPKQ